MTKKYMAWVKQFDSPYIAKTDDMAMRDNIIIAPPEIFRPVFGTDKKWTYNPDQNRYYVSLDYEGLLQSTGIHDKSGNEIYQSDLIIFGMLKYIVEFHDGAFRLKWNDEYFGVLEQQKANDFEVIGNKYESPELLK